MATRFSLSFPLLALLSMTPCTLAARASTTRLVRGAPALGKPPMGESPNAHGEDAHGFMRKARVLKLKSGGTQNDTPCVPGDLCNDGRINSLVMEFTGGNCASSDNTQDEGKWDCAVPRDIDSSNPFDGVTKVRMEILDNGLDVIESVSDASVGGSFSVVLSDGDRLESTTSVYVYNDDDGSSGELLQEVMLHTSCSQPIFVGNTFGAIKLTSARGVDTDEDSPAGAEVCETKPTSADEGCETDLSSEGNLAQLTVMFTGDNCESSNNQQLEDWDCAETGSGDPFDDVASVRIDIVSGDAVIHTERGVAAGSTFTFDPADGETEFEAEISAIIYADDDESTDTMLQHVDFQTNSSTPLLKDETFGAIQLVSSRGVDTDPNSDGPGVCG